MLFLFQTSSVILPDTMIAQLTGTVATKHGGSVILDVGGVGYNVHVLPKTLQTFTDGEDITLFTYLRVRDDEMSLYGFIEHDERAFFELLISVPGVGPKGAMGVLSVASVHTLRTAIMSGDESLLTRVSGIGKRIAERIVVELKEKLPVVRSAGKGRAEHVVHVDVLDALVAMGYRPHEARDAVREIPDSATTAEEGLRAALKELGRKR